MLKNKIHNSVVNNSHNRYEQGMHRYRNLHCICKPDGLINDSKQLRNILKTYVTVELIWCCTRLLNEWVPLSRVSPNTLSGIPFQTCTTEWMKVLPVELVLDTGSRVTSYRQGCVSCLSNHINRTVVIQTIKIRCPRVVCIVSS